MRISDWSSDVCSSDLAVVQILSHLNVKFKGVDVLQDPGIRQGIKDFSNWPTIPQLYVKGEFVGGCYIIREMFQTGELQRSEERRVGKECVSPCRSRGDPNN